MRLMNAELSESLKKFPLYSQDGKKADAVVVAKYFFPATALTWYVTEGRQEDDDYLFFGPVLTPAQKWAISPFPNCLS